jgi:hypothetical protein
LALNKRLEPHFQSNFYRNHYHRMLRIILLCVFVILLLVLLNIYFVFFPQHREYYVSTTGGQLYQWCESQHKFTGLGVCQK